MKPLTLDQWTVLKDQVKVLLASGFFDTTKKQGDRWTDIPMDPDQAMAIALYGAELGIGPMQSLMNITIIHGKPACSSGLLLSLVQSAGHDIRVISLESDETKAVVEYRRKTWQTPERAAFTMAEVKRLGYDQKNAAWGKQPANMLRWRAISAAARVVAADAIHGLYLPEEMGGEYAMNEDGSMGVVHMAPDRAPVAAGAAASTGASLTMSHPIQDLPVDYPPAGELRTPPPDATLLEGLGLRPASDLGPVAETAAEDTPDTAAEGQNSAYRGDLPKASPYKPASANQLATVAKLSRLLGRPDEPDPNMTSAEASERITDLSREYNERKSLSRR